MKYITYNNKKNIMYLIWNKKCQANKREKGIFHSVIKCVAEHYKYNRKSVEINIPIGG